MSTWGRNQFEATMNPQPARYEGCARPGPEHGVQRPQERDVIGIVDEREFQALHRDDAARPRLRSNSKNCRV